MNFIGRSPRYHRLLLLTQPAAFFVPIRAPNPVHCFPLRRCPAIGLVECQTATHSWPRILVFDHTNTTASNVITLLFLSVMMTGFIFLQFFLWFRIYLL